MEELALLEKVEVPDQQEPLVQPDQLDILVLVEKMDLQDQLVQQV
jgi:hypothetical protein